MKIYCKVTAFYKVEATKLKKEYWESIYDFHDAPTFKEQGHEIQYEISIIGRTEETEDVLKNRKFTPSESSKHNISILGHTFQFDSKHGDIVCLDKYITI